VLAAAACPEASLITFFEPSKAPEWRIRADTPRQSQVWLTPTPPVRDGMLLFTLATYHYRSLCPGKDNHIMQLSRSRRRGSPRAYLHLVLPTIFTYIGFGFEPLCLLLFRPYNACLHLTSCSPFDPFRWTCVLSWTRYFHVWLHVTPAVPFRQMGKLLDTGYSRLAK